MPNVTEVIKKYDLAFYAGGTNTNNYIYRAIITLRREDYSVIGAAYFHRTADTMPGTDEQKEDGYIWLHYPEDDYTKVLDMLRNEKPIFLRYSAGWSMGSIGSNFESVGEEEAG